MGILDLGRYKGIVFAITGFLVFIAIILAVNHGKAGQFSDDVSAVKFLAEQREQPVAVYNAGVELAARLGLPGWNLKQLDRRHSPGSHQRPVGLPASSRRALSFFVDRTVVVDRTVGVAARGASAFLKH